jgi:hypothetical protein
VALSGGRFSTVEIAGVKLDSGKEIDGAMREQQNQQGEQNAAGIETPGKQ